jgi:polysaccharide export outer membrane protein
MLRLLALVAALSLSACSDGFVSFPVTPERQAELPKNVEIVGLNAANIGSFAGPQEGHSASSLNSGGSWDYKIGIGDILAVIVFDHPELAAPVGAGGPSAESGFRVQSDGTFFYPFIGQVRATGRAPEEVRAEVTERLATYIPNPQVEVRVAAYNSQHVVISGEVANSTKIPLTGVSTALVDAIAAAGGATETADLRRVTVQRGSKRFVVDVDGFFAAGISKNNPLLQAGDVVNVPRLRAIEAYLLGQILRPSVIDLSKDQISLTQAITRQGGLDEKRADARGVFVFRERREGVITVFQLNIKEPTGFLLGTKFLLEPRDVVYVTRAPIAQWNDSISQLLPTVQAASTVQ